MKNDVLLISMPFAPVVSPSIGLSLIKGALDRKEINSEILYLNLLFAKKTGTTIYSKIATGFPVNHDMIGEWVFSHGLFDTDMSDDQFVHEVLLGNNSSHSKSKYNKRKITQSFIRQLLRMKTGVKSFIDQAAKLVLEKDPTIVGFTSVFQQQVASLALAKRIKELNPATLVCLGGANNEGIMGVEVIRKFPFVDFVVSGEGEDVFPALVTSILAGNICDDQPGIISQSNIHRFLPGQTTNAKLGTHIDELPFVKYDDYFQQLAEVKLDKKFSPRILFETSRGCWWGMKNHCTFCGLNGENMTQRTKSAQRALDEFTYLLKKYPNHEISVVDNILDYGYFKDFIPALIEVRKTAEYDLFYEVKANLSKEQLEMMKESGITVIQPGIESFCKETLKLMRKGVSPLQNIQLLKWCKELNIEAEWNFLYGFPYENMDEYLDVAKLLPLLSHLTPPNSCAPIRLDRFSPNFNQSASLGFKDIRPYPTYNYIYPFEDDSVFNLAYYFTYGYKDYAIDYKRLKQFVSGVKRWKMTHTESALFYSENEDHLLVWDLRPIAKHPIYILSDLTKCIYTLCDKAIRHNQLMQKIQALLPAREIPEEEVRNKLDFLLLNGLMIDHDDHYLSLAINDKNIMTTPKVVSKINNLVGADENSTSGEMVLSETVFA